MSKSEEKDKKNPSRIGDTDKVRLDYNLELERKDDKNLKDSGYDFVPRSNHWLSSDEKKIKTREIEEKTK